MPCGTSSSSTSPASIWVSAAVTGPGRAENDATSRDSWPFSARLCAVGWPGWPSPLQYTVSSRAPWSRNAVIRLDGNRWVTPNPAIATEDPSAMSATAAAGESNTLSALTRAGCVVVTRRPSSLTGYVASQIEPQKISLDR